MKNNKYPFQWGDIEPLVINQLSYKNSISFFATIGSRNIERDIDIISIKNPNAKNSQYLRDIHSLLDILNEWIHYSYDRKIVKFSRFINQEESLHLGDYKDGDLALHLMSYPCYEQFKNIWLADVPSTVDVYNLLKNSKKMKGDIETIKYLMSQPKKEHDSLLYKLQECDKIHSNYDETLLLKCMNETYRYIQKHIKSDNYKYATNTQETREIMYEIADMLES